MSNLQALTDTSRPGLAVDDFEEGWDAGVDWANERAVYRSLLMVQKLHVTKRHDLATLLETLDCQTVDLFGRDDAISKRRVAGFLEGAVAILRES